MGIVQVPYATVTVKYVRALSYGLYSYGLTGLDGAVADRAGHSYGLYSYGLTGLDGAVADRAGHKGAKIFNGRSGIWHLHYAHLAHCHMP